MAKQPHRVAITCKGANKNGAPCSKTTKRGYFCALHRPAPPHPTGPIGLLQLPAELRLMIYSHLDVNGSAPIDITFDDRSKTLQILTLPGARKVKHRGAIIKVCRQIYAEIYNPLRFVFHGEAALRRLQRTVGVARISSKIVEVHYDPVKEPDVPMSLDVHYIYYGITEHLPKCIADG